MLEPTAAPANGPPPPPGSDVDPGPPPLRWSVVKYFFRYLRPLRGLVVLLVMCTVLTGLVPLPMSFLPMVLTQHFNDPDYLNFYLALVLATFLIGVVLGIARAYWGSLLGEAIVRALRRDVFGNLERLSMLAVYSRGPGKYVQQLGRDVYSVRQLFGDTLLRASMEVAMGLATLVSMLILQPVLTVVLMVLFGGMRWPVRLINKKVEFHAGRARDLMEAIMSQVVEYVGGFRDIVAAGRFRVFADRFDGMLQESQRANVRTSLWGQMSGVVPSTVVSLAVLAVYFFWLKRATSVADVGAIITYAGLLSQMFPAMMALVQASTELAMAMPSLQSLKQVLDQPPSTVRPDTVPLRGDIGSIRFDHVALELEGRRIIEDLTFEIPSGKLTAIVGQSGAGKTTLFHLLLRLLEPTSGTILIGQRPVDGYTLDSLRAQIGFIPQNPFIFNDTLRENVLLASPEAPPPEKLARAIEIAQLREVVEHRQTQGGLDAVAGYMGSRLSGGEKQRVALARLVLRDPQVIICDEYTANVDARTAFLIQEAMRTYFAGRTRVVITHELANARGADRIIVIDQGRVVQQGTHEDLREQPGLYRQLLEVQSVS